jgi:hypothetical protein
MQRRQDASFAPSEATLTTQPRDKCFVPQPRHAFVMPEPDIAFVPHRRLSFASMR